MTEPDPDADRERRDCLEQWDAAAGGWDKGGVWMRERAAAVLNRSSSFSSGRPIASIAAWNISGLSAGTIR